MQEQRGGARSLRNQLEVDGGEDQRGAQPEVVQREQRGGEARFDLQRIVNPFDARQRHINVTYIGNAGDESDIGTTLLGLGKKKRSLDLVMYNFGLICL